MYIIISTCDPTSLIDRQLLDLQSLESCTAEGTEDPNTPPECAGFQLQVEECEYG